MKVEDIKVGETYQLHFSSSVGKVMITANLPRSSASMSKEFSDLYGDTAWINYLGNHVTVLKLTCHFPPGVKFHFVNDPPDVYATIYPDFLVPITSFNEVNPASSCQCDVWAMGCVCGAFKAERGQ